MKIKALLIFSCLCAGALKATDHSVAISGNTYSPNVVMADINDGVTIDASVAHPLVQVSSATWSASLTDTLAGGWGVKTANHQFMVTSLDTIFFVCQNHASIGMKGMVIVVPNNRVKLVLNLDRIHFANPVQLENVVFVNNGGDIMDADFYDMQGKKIESAVLEEGYNKIENLQNGMYLVLLRSRNDANVVRREKLLIQ